MHPPRSPVRPSPTSGSECAAGGQGGTERSPRTTSDLASPLILGLIMGHAEGSTTDVSLLLRLGRDPSDQAAWEQFVARYGAKIYAWCRDWRLQEADARDVTQTVLAKLAVQMRR